MPLEYFQRTLQITPLIRDDVDLCQRITNAFKAVYDDPLSETTFFLPQNLNNLGQGRTHVVLGLPGF
ncbi:hypothetical protein J4210_04825 [Candidatus Woesearchaeota archaeon]|nr:hypothetical protein [Candidatus Woesearchaeota archaeon]